MVSDLFFYELLLLGLLWLCVMLSYAGPSDRSAGDQRGHPVRPGPAGQRELEDAMTS